MSEVTILVAKGSPPKVWTEAPKLTTVEVDGHPFVVEPGVTRISSGHPLAKARPDLFEAGKAKSNRVPRNRRGRKPAK